MRISIRNRIFLSVVVIQLLSAGLVAGWYLYAIGAQLRSLTRDKAEQTVLNAIAATKDYFGPPAAIAAVTQRLVAGGVLDRTRPDQLERFLFEQLKRAPQVAGLYVGYPDGSFYYVMRSDDGAPGGTRTKLVLMEQAGRTVRLIWRDAAFKQLRAATDPADSYDPRSRGWYRAAAERRTAIWTEPYIFFTARTPGITTAVPLIDANGAVGAVVGVDIEITAVSQFLKEIGVRNRGSAFILAPEGDIIAHQRAELVLSDRRGSGDALRFRKVGELPGVEAEAGKSAMDPIRQPRNATAPTSMWETAFEGRDYVVASGGIGDANWPWRVISIVPSAEFASVLRSVDLLLFGVLFLATILACAFGYGLSVSVGRPLAALHRDAQLARHGNFEVMEEINSGYREIDETNEILRELSRHQRGRD